MHTPCTVVLCSSPKELSLFVCKTAGESENSCCVNLLQLVVVEIFIRSSLMLYFMQNCVLLYYIYRYMQKDLIHRSCRWQIKKKIKGCRWMRIWLFSATNINFVLHRKKINALNFYLCKFF